MIYSKEKMMILQDTNQDKNIRPKKSINLLSLFRDMVSQYLLKEDFTISKLISYLTMYKLLLYQNLEKVNNFKLFSTQKSFYFAVRIGELYHSMVFDSKTISKFIY